MKKLLLIFLAISSTLSFSIVKSSNYQSRYFNDDGSVTIVRPTFPNPRKNENLKISVEDDSNLEGVCKFFGQRKYVSNSARYVDAQNETSLIRVSVDGTFVRFESGYHKNALESLICLPVVGLDVKSSRNAENISTNDDGTVTIIKPMFSNADGTGNLKISISEENNSNLDGVCRLFGQGKYVSNSVRYVDARNSSTLVVISSWGTFEKFEPGYRKNAIESLLCFPPVHFQSRPSKNAESIFHNDDGAITIYRPMFSDPDGTGNLRISVEDESNLEGVCKLFGKEKYVSNSARYEKARSRTLLARISNVGLFDRFDESYRKDALKSLICNDSYSSLGKYQTRKKL